jgi:hypothetical protein
MSRVVAAKRKRLLDLIGRRERWRDELDSVRHLHTHILEAERILSGASLQAQSLAVTNTTVGQYFDAWRGGLNVRLNEQSLTPTERRCLEHFLHVTANMRPHLIQCYDLERLPRTNNDMEGFIRAIKIRYRRISGRKNWNRYLLRYGRRVAYYEALAQQPDGLSDLTARVRCVPHPLWRVARSEQRHSQQEQLKQYRVRYRRKSFLAGLEARWAELAACTPLLP